MILCLILLFQVVSGGGRVSGGAKVETTAGVTPPSGIPWAGILDPSRAIDWRETGFPIQEPSSPCANQVTPLTPSGGDDAAAINSAIAGCAAGGYIQLAAGTFQINSTGILFNAISNVVLRGAGTMQTKLIMANSGINCLGGANYICLYGNTNGPAGFPGQGGGGAVWTGDNGVTGSYAKGDTVLDLGAIVGSAGCNSITTCLSVGQMVMLDQRNDSIGFLTSGTGCSESGTTVTCNTSIPHQLTVGDRIAVGGSLMTNNNDCGQSSPASSTTAGYGGWWTVSGVPTSTSFTYTATTTGLPVCTGGFVAKDTGGVAVMNVVPFTTENNNNYLGRQCPNQGSPGLLAPTCTSTEASFRGVQETHVITAIDTANNRITIDPPVFMNHYRSTQAPGISWTGAYPARYITGDGIEELTIDASAQNVRNNSTITLINAYKCWVKNTRIISQDIKRITIMASMRIDILNNYIYGTINTTNNNYAINPYTASSSLLIENNICDNISGCVIDEGSFGNVEAYNYYVASSYSSPGWLPSTFAQHGITGYNLLEGNNSPHIQADVWHGATWGLTIFRSRARGQDVVYRDTNNYAITINANNRGENIVGNILGTTSTHSLYSVSAQMAPGAIYNLGFSVSNAINVPFDPLVAQSLLRWGNYDVVNNSTQWNPAEVPTTALPYIGANAVPASTILPHSFYLATQPVFWQIASGLGTGTPPWPPIGPDITASGPLDTTCAVAGGLSGSSTTCDGEGHHAYQLPAQICWNQTAVDPVYRQTATVTSATWVSNVATLTLSAPATLTQYEVITVSGVTPSTYNGMFLINNAVTSGTSVVYSLPVNPGGAGSGGSISWRNVRSYNPHACYANPG